MLRALHCTVWRWFTPIFVYYFERIRKGLRTVINSTRMRIIKANGFTIAYSLQCTSKFFCCLWHVVCGLFCGVSRSSVLRIRKNSRGNPSSKAAPQTTPIGREEQVRFSEVVIVNSHCMYSQHYSLVCLANSSMIRLLSA